MSEENSPEPVEIPRKSGKGVVIGLLAGVLGLGVGVGLYLWSANGGKPGATTDADAGACVVDRTLHAKLDGAAGGDVAAFGPLDRPHSMVSTSFKDAAGAQKTFADWKGKTVLFNLWATWCAPCRAEMPALDALQKELGGDTFEVVPVSMDLGSDELPKQFYADAGLKHLRFFHDSESKIFFDLKKKGLAFGLPATLLLSREGCVLGTLNGPAEWSGDDAKKLIRAAM